MKCESEISNPPNLFLDTSIQIERDTASSDKKDELTQLLQTGNQLCTSTYVKMEYRWSRITDLVYLYNLLVEAENLADALYRIERLQPQHHRKLQRVLISLAGFLSDPGTEEIKMKDLVDYALPYFRSIIDNWAELFDKGVDYNILDETGCYISKGTPVLKGTKYDSGISNCKAAYIRCKIVEFFRTNLDKFNMILKKLSEIPSLDEEQEKSIGVLKKAVEYPQNIADVRNCRRCGDAIIAIECPDDSVILTKNEKHFGPICEIINKELLIYK